MAETASNSEFGAAERSHWPVVRGSLREIEADEPDLSATTTAEERLAMMWQLAKDVWAFRGEPIVEPEFSRHITRIIRREC